MLTIANLDANYYVPGGAPMPAVEVRTRLDLIARHRLPAAVAERLSPPPGEAEAVVRIRHLAIDLWIDAVGMHDGEIARRWATLAARSITRALLAGSPANVVCYDDAPHFVAAFLGDVLSGQAWSRWMYGEFAPLRDLPPGKIAALLLSARPALLAAVASRLARSGQLEPLIHQMQPADVRLILRDGLGLELPPAAPPASAALAAVLHTLRSGVALERGGAAAQTRNTLRLYLAAIVAEPELIRQPAAFAVAYHLALVYSLWSARPARAFWQALGDQEIDSPDVLGPPLDNLAGESAPAAAFLRIMLTTTAGRTYLARLIPAVVPDVEAPDPAPVGTRRSQSRRAPKIRRTASAFAGLALLLPAIRDLNLHQPLGVDGIYQLLLATAGRTLRPLAWGDLGVAWLAGATTGDTERARNACLAWPDPAAWDERGDLLARAEEAGDHLGSLPCAAFALAVLRRFARDLRGFDSSSPAFLAAQFLHVPGAIHWLEESMEVYLSRAPLGIVLQMAGLTGDQGRIPWLENRQLAIRLPV